MSSAVPAGRVWLACLCAAWCRTCDAYEAVLREVAAEFPGLAPRWIDIEDEADLVGDCDIETFPTLVLFDERRVLFFGPLTPQPETLRRVLRAALASGGAAAAAPEVEALAARLRAG